METTARFEGRQPGQPVTMGDFVPQILVIGPRPRSRLLVAGCLRSQTDPNQPFDMSPRESFSLARLCFAHGLRAMLSQAKSSLRTLFRGKE